MFSCGFPSHPRHSVSPTCKENIEGHPIHDTGLVLTKVRMMNQNVWGGDNVVKRIKLYQMIQMIQTKMIECYRNHFRLDARPKPMNQNERIWKGMLIQSVYIELTQELPPWCHALWQCFSPGWQHQLEWPRWVGAGYAALDNSALILLIQYLVILQFPETTLLKSATWNWILSKQSLCMNTLQSSYSSGRKIRDNPECMFLNNTTLYSISVHSTRMKIHWVSRLHPSQAPQTGWICG